MSLKPRRKTGKARLLRRRTTPAKAVRRRRLTALAGVVVLLLICGLWLAKGLLSPPAPPPYKPPAKAPPFEEPHVPPADHALRTIDEALLTALRDSGIESKEVQISLSVSPREELTLFKVRLDKRRDLKPLLKNIKERLAATKGKAAWRDIPGGRELTVRLNGRVTHRLSLLMPPTRPAKPPMPPPPAPKPQRPRVALVMDDMGYHMEPFKRLLALHLPMTFSLLPHSTHAGRISSLAAEQGREVMVHLPMEPKSYPRLKPGPGALLTSMTPAKLAQITKSDLASVPGAVGANNHMGSRFTEDKESLRPVLLELKKRGLFFVDSLTSPRSQAFPLARQLGLTAGRRDIFLDHDHSPKAVKRSLERLLRLNTCCNGYIVIAHPHDSTLEALEAYRGRLKQKLDFFPVSRLLKKAKPAPAAKADVPHQNGP